MIMGRFNNGAIQERVKTCSQGLRFKQFLKHVTSPTDALIKLVSTIKRNYAKTPPSWQCKENNLEVLENAVYGIIWARSPIDWLHVYLKTFEDFYGACQTPYRRTSKSPGTRAIAHVVAQRGDILPAAEVRLKDKRLGESTGQIEQLWLPWTARIPTRREPSGLPRPVQPPIVFPSSGRSDPL